MKRKSMGARLLKRCLFCALACALMGGAFVGCARDGGEEPKESENDLQTEEGSDTKEETKPREYPALRILFIGNSLTYYNDMPAMVMNLGLAMGRDIYTEKIAVGSATMCQQISTTTDVGKQVAAAMEKEWDFVVVQPSRRITDRERTVYDAEFAAGQVLDEMIKSTGAKTVIYNTWGNNNNAPGVFVMNVDGINATKTGSYTISRADHNLWMQQIGETFSEVLDAPVVDTAELFEFMVTKQPAVNMYYTDERHPSLYGSFAVACAFYGFFYEESATEAAKRYHAGIDDKVAELLARAADHVVLGSEAPTDPVIPGQSGTAAVSVEPVAWSGTGSKTDPYLIASAGNFMYLVKLSTEGESFGGKYIKQTANVDLKGGELTPVGRLTPFEGCYDGGGCSVTDYSITDTTGSAGLFAQTKGATLSNIVIGNATFKGKYAGAVVGTAKSGTTVSGCRVLESASVEGSDSVGGIVGEMDASTVRGCVNHTTVTAVTVEGHCFAGGMVGLAKGKSLITLCYNEGSVTVTNETPNACNGCGGGILGCEGASGSGGCDLIDCVNRGLILFTSTSTKVRSYTGGIIGRASAGSTAATVRNCYNTGDIKSNSKNTSYTKGIGQICGVYVNKVGIKLEYCYGLDTVSHTLTETYGADPRYSNYVAGKEGSSFSTGDYFRLSDKLNLKTSAELEAMIRVITDQLGG